MKQVIKRFVLLFGIGISITVMNIQAKTTRITNDSSIIVKDAKGASYTLRPSMDVVVSAGGCGHVYHDVALACGEATLNYGQSGNLDVHHFAKHNDLHVHDKIGGRTFKRAIKSFEWKDGFTVTANSPERNWGAIYVKNDASNPIRVLLTRGPGADACTGDEFGYPYACDWAHEISPKSGEWLIGKYNQKHSIRVWDKIGDKFQEREKIENFKSGNALTVTDTYPRKVLSTGHYGKCKVVKLSTASGPVDVFYPECTKLHVYNCTDYPVTLTISSSTEGLEAFGEALKDILSFQFGKLATWDFEIGANREKIITLPKTNVYFSFGNKPAGHSGHFGYQVKVGLQGSQYTSDWYIYNTTPQQLKDGAAISIVSIKKPMCTCELKQGTCSDADLKKNTLGTCGTLQCNCKLGQKCAKADLVLDEKNLTCGPQQCICNNSKCTKWDLMKNSDGSCGISCQCKVGQSCSQKDLQIMEHPVMVKGKRVMQYVCGNPQKATLIKGTKKATLGYKATVGTNGHAALDPTVTNYDVKNGKFCAPKSA